ncbi:serine protease [Flavobacterium columnare]|uniref:Serine protease n=1 Tax=Flavobacterium columnare TaxID=996 RepID=A0AAJ3ZK18_9FLAO|nr:trypsin-like peptidase domain-containing protein [Flavobacterium columnare]ANO47597.1 Serine protease [Flavobacterium columnare]APT21776.1 serine protease [Flavobacterium columnare]AUX19051.1 hypothetical protein AQ623_12775 [Flavobacterium columnare]MEB3802080.1 trypsin-like peptidase domain-containing protein [Flavobacterium columnare]PDS22696.1 serine protease [Flavobacterium columnare] [Flavobacterium columnare NBRC 100251 = ATCC 23463]
MYKNFLLAVCFFNVIIVNAQSKMIDVSPSDALVYDENNTLLGKTPYEITKNGSFVLKIKKENFKLLTLEIKNDEKNEEIQNCFANPDKFYININNNTAIFNLIPYRTEKKGEIFVGFANPSYKIDENELIGTVNESKRYLKSKNINFLLGHTTNLENRIFEAFGDTFVQPVFFDQEKEKEEKSLLLEPRVILKPIIKNLDFNLKGKILREYVGNYHIEIEWFVFDRNDLNNPKFSYDTKVDGYRLKNNYNLLLHDLVYFSQLELLKNEGLYQKFLEIENSYLKETIGNELNINILSEEKYQENEISGYLDSVVTIESGNTFGSGFFINNEGYILTNFHIGSIIDDYFVTVNNKRIKAEVVKSNKNVDLLLLKIDHKSKGLPIVKKDFKKIGQEVFAIGTPLDKTLEKSVTKGIVSNYRKMNGVDFIQSDVSINSGNSGGPLINKFGEVLAINTLKMNQANTNGIGFAIDINYALKMLNIKKLP